MTFRFLAQSMKSLNLVYGLYRLHGTLAGTGTIENENAFQHDAHRPLVWSPSDVSAGGGGNLSLGCARFAEIWLKYFWVSYFVEFVLVRFSYFNIAIAYSNSKFCGAWTPKFLWVHLQFKQNEHTPGGKHPPLEGTWDQTGSDIVPMHTARLETVLS